MRRAFHRSSALNPPLPRGRGRASEIPASGEEFTLDLGGGERLRFNYSLGIINQQSNVFEVGRRPGQIVQFVTDFSPTFYEADGDHRDGGPGEGPGDRYHPSPSTYLATITLPAEPCAAGSGYGSGDRTGRQSTRAPPPLPRRRPAAPIARRSGLRRRLRRPSRRGAALLVALVVVSLVMMFTVALMDATRLRVKAAGNTRDYEIASLPRRGRSAPRAVRAGSGHHLAGRRFERDLSARFRRPRAVRRGRVEHLLRHRRGRGGRRRRPAGHRHRRAGPEENVTRVLTATVKQGG